MKACKRCNRPCSRFDHCKKCRAQLRRWSAAWRARHPEASSKASMRWQAKKAKAGLCSHCGDEPLVSEKLGEQCLRERQEWHLERKPPKRRCRACGQLGHLSVSRLCPLRFKVDAAQYATARVSHV